ncbi:hypothetical protein [Bdellovibrio sp.]|uniref:hypothetical protein n=1 Tax=Bdellovibrio sp. TaxID=28201 RepID=UPI0039E69F58
MFRTIEKYIKALSSFFGESWLCFFMWLSVAYMALGVGYPQIIFFIPDTDADFRYKLLSILGVFFGVTLTVHKQYRTELLEKCKKENLENNIYQILTKLSESLVDLYIDIPTFVQKKLDPEQTLGTVISGYGLPSLHNRVFDLIKEQKILDVDKYSFKSKLAELINHYDELQTLADNQKDAWIKLTSISNVPLKKLIVTSVEKEPLFSVGPLNPYPTVFVAIDDFIDAEILFRAKVFETIAMIEKFLRQAIESQMVDSNESNKVLIRYLHKQSDWMKQVSNFDNKTPLKFFRQNFAIEINREIEIARVNRLRSVYENKNIDQTKS